MTFASDPSGKRRLRSPRGIAAVFLMVAYLLDGTLHSLYDIDVTNPAGSSIVATQMNKDVDLSGKGLAVEHHCHGCFSVSVPIPVILATPLEPTSKLILARLTHDSGLAPGLDPPPPRHLT